MTYPISFEVDTYSVVGSRTAGSATGYWAFCLDDDDFGTTGFYCHLQGNVYWIAIGK